MFNVIRVMKHYFHTIYSKYLVCETDWTALFLIFLSKFVIFIVQCRLSTSVCQPALGQDVVFVDVFVFCFVTSCVCIYHPQQKGAMTVTKVVTVVKTKKGPHTHKKKGELMENDQDAMEVSFPCVNVLFVTEVTCSVD